MITPPTRGGTTYVVLFCGQCNYEHEMEYGEIFPRNCEGCNYPFQPYSEAALIINRTLSEVRTAVENKYLEQRFVMLTELNEILEGMRKNERP